MLVTQVNSHQNAESLHLGPSELETLRTILFRADGLESRAAPVEIDNRAKCVAIARQIYKFRRKREDRMSQIFGSGLFADPAWDLLLDLYVHTGEGRKVSISSACLGAAAPETTALRYIAEFEKMGVVERSRHDADRRVQLVCLSPLALGLMDEICGQFADLINALT